MSDQIVLNPDSPFEMVVASLVVTHRKKNADYAGSADLTGGEGDPYINFIDVAYQLSLTPGESVEAHIATKQARLRNILRKHLMAEGTPMNEGIDDTLLDRAVYAVISLVLWRQGQYEPTAVPVLERS